VNSIARSFLLLALLTLLAGCNQEPSHDFVQDPAGLLSSAQQQRLKEFQQLLLTEQDVDFLLVILDQAAVDLDQQALDLFELNRLGEQTAGARGLLLLVDPLTEQARIEVGYDLEGIFPDGFIAGLEYDQMLPFFQQQRVGHGVEAITELLVARLFEQDEKGVDPGIETAHLSGGAGARISTTGSVKSVVAAPAGTYLPQPTPLATLDVYRQVLRDRSKDPDLDIYTPESRSFFRNWLVTDAQQQNSLKSLDNDFALAAELVQGELAVIRFPVGNRHAAPYYLKNSAHGWQLDFVEMSRTIGFNHRNQWHFRDRSHAYMFAFDDWRFDQHGFPHARRQ
jgi:uncharacterized membrane protein YgcG